LSCIVGDLSKPQLGIEQHRWQTLSQEVDVVIHNGATVHWVRRYQDMMASNVISTIDAMKLCNEGKPKLLAFVLQVCSILITTSNSQSNKSALAKTLSLRTMTCRAVELVLVLAMAKRNECLSSSSIRLGREVSGAL
jgi:thioester reductase-like protein